MWLRVALDKDSVHYNTPICCSYVEGPGSEEYYFDVKTAAALEADGFLIAMWDELDALFDWGDCDFFLPDKCVKFSEWLTNRLRHDADPVLKKVYTVMLDYSNKAIANNTGISFDF